MTHVKIMKKCAKKLDADASKYMKDEKKTKSKIKKKHDKIEKKEASQAASIMKSRAKKAHEY